MHPDFPTVIDQVWGANPTLEKVVHSFGREVTTWACSNIGNIFKHKNKLMRRIQGIQKSDSYYYSTFLRNLEKDLIADFNLIL